MNKDILEKGYVFMPYISKTVKTTINGETVWYANKWKNLLLKIKYFFIKPKYMKNAHIYKNKVANSTFYGTVKITGDDKQNESSENLNISNVNESRWNMIPDRCEYNGKIYRILNIELQGGYFTLQDLEAERGEVQVLDDIDMDKCIPTCLDVPLV